MPGHSAHVGEEVVVHYRWHPLHGRRVRRYYCEQRASGRFVHLEAAPGVVTVVAEWMLDAVACAGMELGEPRVAVTALADLHLLLIDHGFRRSSQDEMTIVQEEQDEASVTFNTASTVPGSTPDKHAVRVSQAPRDEPGRTRHRGGATGRAFDGRGGSRDGGERP